MKQPAATDKHLPTPLAQLDHALEALQQARQAPDFPLNCDAVLDNLQHALARARGALATGLENYRALFDAVPDPVSIISREGVVLDLNRASIRAYDRTREAIVGQHLRVLNPDLPKDFLAPVLDIIDRGETHVAQSTNIRADGSRFPVEVHSARLRLADQDTIVAVARDLSARQEAEARYWSLAESIDQAITLHEANGHSDFMNAAAARIFGQQADGAPQTNPDWSDWMLVDEQGRPLPPEAHPAQRALREGHTIFSEVIGLFHRKTKRLVWLSVTAIPQFSPGSTHAGHALAISSDITDLQRDKTLFRRVQELAQIGGWQWDRGNGGLYLSSEAIHILGAATPPRTMDAVLACLIEDDRQQLRHTLRTISDGTGFDLELQGQQMDGTPFWARMIGEPDPHDPGHTRFSGTLQDITERKRAEEDLRLQAQTDALTGLLNRDAILAHIAVRLDAAAGPNLAVLYIDLDRFKIVNDVLGHDAGDHLLVEAAHRIRQSVAGEGLIARFGGDEFLVICQIADDESRSERLALQIQKSFNTPFRLGKDEFKVTTSIGIARAPSDGDTPRQLIQSADVAMYDSKRRHRNGYQAFSASLASRQQERLQVETQLRRALDNGEFHLVYQPQVDLRTGRFLSAEALLRWNNPVLGAMPPDRFIAVAEATGEIVRIDHWVLQEACAQMRRWQEQGLPIQHVAVNISYHQFAGEDLARSIERSLQQAGLPGHALELEMTERVLIEDSSDTLRTLAELRALGVQLSIDDFGEGYSALHYLRRLPIHTLKLSHGFLKGVPGNPSDVAICQAVAGIASSLKLGIVAEGVETELQRDFLLRLGVTVGQGFLFSPGVLPGEFARRMLAQQD